MKKGLFILSLVCVLSLGLAGCGMKNSDTTRVTQDNASNSTTMEAEAPKTGAEDDGAVVNDSVDNQNNTQNNANNNGQTGTAVTDDSNAAGTGSVTVTEAQAKEIALEDAGIKAEDVTGIRVNKDKDDGREVYDVEFYVDNKEYDYEIDIATGKILDKDFDIENDFKHYASGTEDGIISRDKAIEIVLKKVSGASGDDVWIELDEDDGYQVYEGEIRYNNKEYEFELNAEDGSILEWSEEYDD